MAAPPDLINDPPSLICRYKDSFLLLPLVSSLLQLGTHGHQKSVERASRRAEQTFISVLERANARKASSNASLRNLSPSSALLLPCRCRRAPRPRCYRVFQPFYRLVVPNTGRQIGRPYSVEIQPSSPPEIVICRHRREASREVSRTWIRCPKEKTSGVV